MKFSPFICFIHNIQLCFFISVYKSDSLVGRMVRGVHGVEGRNSNYKIIC